MVLIDTDVLLVEFRYSRDTRFQVNTSFLSRVKADEPCITVYNLMEFLGQMSFNMPSDKLVDWDRWLEDEYGLSILWPETSGLDATSFFRTEIYDRPFSRMIEARGGMPFNDALIIGLGERTPGVDALVTWNARHFLAKTKLSVLTPEEYLQRTER